MAEEQEQTTGRELSRSGRMKFWIGVVVATMRWVSADRDERVAELNDRYVEKIEIRSQSRAGGSQDVIVIDGASRYDCEEEDGRLVCEDDPQPTEEDPEG